MSADRSVAAWQPAQLASKGFITVLGIDPGLRRMGFAVAEVDCSANVIREVLRIGVLETDRSHQRMARKTSDDFLRARRQSASLRQILKSHAVDLVAAEISTTTPYIYPTFSFGVMIGVLASLERPVIEVLPYEAKIAATGDAQATKREVISWALDLPAARHLEWPCSPRANNLGLTHRGRNLAKTAEHPADALAVIQAAFQTEQIQLAQALSVTKPG